MAEQSEQRRSPFGGLFGSISTAAGGRSQPTNPPPPQQQSSPFIPDIPNSPVVGQGSRQGQTVSDLLGGLDAAQLHPMAGLGQGLEYLELDPSVVGYTPNKSQKTFLPSRGWSDDLCYGTGGTYLTGLSIGGAWGFMEGMRRARQLATSSITPMAAAQNVAAMEGVAGAGAAAAPATSSSPRTRVSARLRLNTVLNAMTRRGPFIGNSCGVVALMYNVIHSTIGGLRNGKQDLASSLASGTIAAALFKSTTGLRPMGTAALMGLGAASAWNGAKYVILGSDDS